MAQDTFMSLLKDTINKLEDGTLLNNGKRFSYSTIKSYKGVYNTMKKYKFNFDLDVLDLNSVTDRRQRVKAKKLLQGKVNKYITMLLDDMKHPNTRKSHLKTIRTTLRKGEEEYGYWFPKLKSIPEVNGEVIAMTPEQVEIFNSTMPVNKELHHTYYYTRMMLYSCMRVSDLVRFECNIDGDAVSIITTKGMGSVSTFYLPQDVKEYISKNPFTFCIKTFREQLKKLLMQYDEFCKEKIVYYFDHEGNPVKERKKLYDLFTPHKLRSSGITYHLSKGLSELEVRNISGHKNGSTAFYRYVQHSETKSIEKQKDNVNMFINI